ncbi:MAG: TIGR04283 family arsenosugar biosynthesis glycosyltransferase [Spirochaetes bacterium]|nr:TIGR04283 family arsenosugar biosynthesis glycosyltransferase [Spirochaetota bacterium]
MSPNRHERDSLDKTAISVIVPVYNESANIGAFLEHLLPIKNHCEIIIVDGGSGDNTAAQVQQKGFFVTRSPEKGRANQMNHGAALAGGDILWFLHADSIPPADPLSKIRSALAKGYDIGCFPIRFDSRHPLMFIFSFLSNNLRARLFNIAFGDQGIFLRKTLFTKLGGYATIPLMEDYKLSLDARAAGCRLALAKGKITTSARRYCKYGMLKTMWLMQGLQRRFCRGDDIEEIARAYDAR